MGRQKTDVIKEKKMKYEQKEIPAEEVIVFWGEMQTVPPRFIERLESLIFQGNAEGCTAKIKNLPRTDEVLRIKIFQSDRFRAERKTFFKAIRREGLRWLFLSQEERFEGDGNIAYYELVSYKTFIARVTRWIGLGGCRLEGW